MLVKGHIIIIIIIIIIKLDGEQHYSDGNKADSPKKYADLVKYDKKMKLLGYDVFRFSGYEFVGEKMDYNLLIFLKKY